MYVRVPPFFKRVRNSSFPYYKSVHVSFVTSVCSHVTTGMSLDTFLLNLVLGAFTEIYVHIAILVKFGQQSKNLREDLHEFLRAEVPLENPLVGNP